MPRSIVFAMSVFFALSFAATALPVSAEEEAGAFEEQQFLFLLEPAYIQSEGQWQVSAFWDHAFDPAGNEFAFSVEYGVTDRLQLSASVPMIDGAQGSGFGDISFAADAALLREASGDGAQVTLGVELSLPSGRASLGTGAGGWSREVSLRAAKVIASGVHVHASTSYGWVPGGGPDADSVREWSFGAGAAFETAFGATLTVEFLRQRGREEAEGDVERTRETYASAGLVFEIAEGVEAGGALVAGLSRDATDARAVVGLQAEW